MTGSSTVEAAVWAAYILAVLGVLPSALRPPASNLGAARRWVASNWRSIMQVAGDFLMALSYGAVPLVLLSAVNADLVLAGAVRVSQTVLGPLMVLYITSALYQQPVLAGAGPIRSCGRGSSARALSTRRSALSGSRPRS